MKARCSTIGCCGVIYGGGKWSLSNSNIVRIFTQMLLNITFTGEDIYSRDRSGLKGMAIYVGGCFVDSEGETIVVGDKS